MERIRVLPFSLQPNTLITNTPKDLYADPTQVLGFFDIGELVSIRAGSSWP